MRPHPLINRLLRIALFFIALELFLHLGVPSTRLYFMLQEKMRSSKEPVYKILCLGDSITFHGGENSYPVQLEKKLNEQAGKKIFKVYNQGIPGQTSNEILNVLDDVLDQYHPDLAITMLGAHDIVFSVVVNDSWVSKLKLNVLGKLKTYLLLKDLKSQLADYLQAKQHQSMETGAYVASLQADAVERAKNLEMEKNHDRTYGMKRKESLLSPHALTIRNYNQVIDHLRNKNIRVFVMQYPLVSEKPLKDMIIRRDGITFVSNEENFLRIQKTLSDDQLFYDFVGGVFGHFKPVAAEIIAQDLADKILTFCKMDENCRVFLK